MTPTRLRTPSHDSNHQPRSEQVAGQGWPLVDAITGSVRSAISAVP
ncbi:hypothetical protein ACX9R5_13760 [Rathayibacter sp. CAU 1779]